MRRLPWLGLGIALAITPLFLQGYPLRLATEVVAWALAATSLAFLFRTTGLVSLGHAAFFGGGAYITALLVQENPAAYLLALPLAGASGFMAAVFLGLLGLRSHGIQFLMLTLAFSQLIYILVKQGFPEFTGGDDGLSGIPKPPGLDNPIAFYLVSLCLLAVTLVAYSLLLRSPLGQVWDALRLNEKRLNSLGFNTHLYKLLAFGLSGALGAVAGVVLASHRGFVHPHDLAWNTSGLLLVMAVVGGIRGISSGTVGATALILLEAALSSYTDIWNLFIGLFLMGYVIFTLRTHQKRGEVRGSTTA